MGLLGDLCGEAEYLWKRLATVHVALERCNNAGLRRRFSFELKLHIELCQEMKVVVNKLGSTWAFSFISILLIKRTCK